jgi:hypothetical protein
MKWTVANDRTPALGIDVRWRFASYRDHRETLGNWLHIMPPEGT